MKGAWGRKQDTTCGGRVAIFGGVGEGRGMLSGRRAFWICGVMLAGFGGVSFWAASTKGATYDEVVHAPAGYTYLRYFDYRANPEHPPLWKYWAAIPWVVRGADA